MSFILQTHCSTASLFVFLSLSASTAESPFCTSAESLRSSRGNSCLCRLFLSTFASNGHQLCSFQTLYLITYLDETLHSIWRSHSLIKRVLKSDQEPGYCVWCWGVAFCQVCSHSPKHRCRCPGVCLPPSSWPSFSLLILKTSSILKTDGQWRLFNPYWCCHLDVPHHHVTTENTCLSKLCIY